MAISKKLAAAAAAATLVFSFTAEAAPTLRVGSLTVYPPFEYLDSKTGQYEGFDMDLIREIGRRNDLDIRIVSMSLDGLVPALISGNIDCAVSALTITPERSESSFWVRPASLRSSCNFDFLPFSEIILFATSTNFCSGAS